jgi:superfamily I DNA and/or RNA helicase
MSMVRSNLKREIGFLGDKRRINVAVTRARVHIAIVCDVDTCSSDPFICDLLEHMSSVGEILTYVSIYIYIYVYI